MLTQVVIRLNRLIEAALVAEARGDPPEVGRLLRKAKGLLESGEEEREDRENQEKGGGKDGKERH